MDIIYMNSAFQDIGIVKDCAFDHEASTNVSKCTFQIATTVDDNVLNIGDYFYITNGNTGTEYGGHIEEIKIDTAKGIATLSGRTWRGILGGKILEPDPGEDYYTVSGDLNANIREIISRVGLTDIFEGALSTSISVNYQFKRYVNAYNGILAMLSNNGYTLSLTWNQTAHKVILEAVEVINYSNESELTSDLFDFIIKKSGSPINHIIGLGSGNLAARQVVHKYLQEDGTVGDTQFYFGKDEIAEVYDYPNVESLEDLEENTASELKERMRQAESLEIKTNDDLHASIGDCFTAHDVVTDISITQYVVDIITTIENDIVQVNYEIGDAIK